MKDRRDPLGKLLWLGQNGHTLVTSEINSPPLAALLDANCKADDALPTWT